MRFFSARLNFDNGIVLKFDGFLVNLFQYKTTRHIGFPKRHSVKTTRNFVRPAGRASFPTCYDHQGDKRNAGLVTPILMLLHILRVDYCEACHLTPAIVPQLVDDWICLFWGHIRHIIDNCKNDLDKALFFVGKTIENNWSGAALLNFLGTDLYERQGKAFTDYPPVRFRSNSAPIMQVRALFLPKNLVVSNIPPTFALANAPQRRFAHSHG